METSLTRYELHILYSLGFHISGGPNIVAAIDTSYVKKINDDVFLLFMFKKETEEYGKHYNLTFYNSFEDLINKIKWIRQS